MGLFKKSKGAGGNTNTYPTLPRNSDPKLPGTCGYHSNSGLGRHAMPPDRLTYVRPDGKPG